MNLSVSTTDLEPFPICNSASKVVKPEGILNSNYKKVAKCNSSSNASLPIFKTRRQINNRRYQFTPGIDALLKLSVFIIALAVIF